MTAVSVSLAKAAFIASASDPDPATTGKEGLTVTKDVIEGFGPIWCCIPSKILPKTVPARTTPAAVSRGFVSAAGYNGIIMRAGFLIDAMRFIKPDEARLKDKLLPEAAPNVLQQQKGSNPGPADSAVEMAGGTGGQATTVQCPPDYLITGLFGQATKANVITVGLRCKRAE